MNKKLLLAAGLAGAAAQVAAQVVAQTPAAPQSVVVTGSVRERALLDAPYAISVIDAETLRASGPQINLSEGLARVPGLVVANRNNYAQDLQVSSRGFGARAGFGVRGLRLYSDGIPATMPDGQGQVAHFDLASAQRIEVLRGPFSVLYGNASGGVIALFSAPATTRRFEAAADAGSFGLRQLRVQGATPLDGGFDLALSASAMESTGFRPRSEAQRTLGNVRLGWQGAADKLTFQLGSQEQSAQDPLGLDRAQFNADPRQTTSQATQFNTRKTINQTQAGANWRHRFEAAGALSDSSVSVYGGQRGVVQWLAIAPATQANVRHGGGVIDFDRSYSGADARLTWRFTGLDVVAGVTAERQQDARRGYENFTGTGAAQVLGVTGALRRDETNRADTREGFAQADWGLTNEVSLTAGLRSGTVTLSASDAYLGNGDDSGSVKFRYTNPVAGARWRATPSLTLHASAARGFESPTLGELAYGPNGIGGFNAALKGQGSRQFEMGAKWRQGAFSADLTAFLADTSDEIGVNTNSGGRQSFQNVGRTRRSGFEASGAWQIAAAWRASVAFTVLDAKYVDGFLTCPGIPCTTTGAKVAVAAGNRIAGTQRGSAFAELAWRGGMLGDWAIEARGMSQTAVNDRNDDFAGAYVVMNLRASREWALGGDGLRLQVLGRIDNLADRVHAGSVIVNEANARFFEPGAPRSALLGVRLLKRW